MTRQYMDPQLNSDPTGGREADQGTRREAQAHPDRRRPGRGRGGRAGRGDLRNVILSLLGTGPMHGYQIITVINAATDGNWNPSPGAIYPTLSMLEDEGLISISTESGRKMARLTDSGERAVAENQGSWGSILEAYRNPGDGEAERNTIRQEYYRIRELIKAAPESESARIIEILRKAADDITRL